MPCSPPSDPGTLLGSLPLKQQLQSIDVLSNTQQLLPSGLLLSYHLWVAKVGGGSDIPHPGQVPRGRDKASEFTGTRSQPGKQSEQTGDWMKARAMKK